MKQPDIVGVISDTHGLLRPEAIEALQGSQLIIHAGDVGKPEILDELRKIATVSAVRGNVDKTSWAAGLPMTKVVEIGEATVYVLHDLNQLDLDPAVAGFSAVISGHSHRPSAVQKNGVLFLNPGSAGPRRFNLPVSVALLRVTGKIVEPQIVELRV
jgi:putative phosphoesterase